MLVTGTSVMKQNKTLRPSGRPTEYNSVTTKSKVKRAIKIPRGGDTAELRSATSAIFLRPRETIKRAEKRPRPRPRRREEEEERAQIFAFLRSQSISSAKSC